MEWLYKIGLTSIVASIAYLVGGWDKGMQILLMLVITDYITGLIHGSKTVGLNSKVGAKGVWKKVCMYIVIAVSVAIERFLDQPESLHNVVVYFYVVNEAISILENVGEFTPIPDALKQFIERLRDKDKDKDGDKK